MTEIQFTVKGKNQVITVYSFLLKSNCQKILDECIPGNSLAVQWLGLRASTAGGLGLIPGWGTKIPQAGAQPKTKKKYTKNINSNCLWE